jgi:hypothetical protein
MTLREISFLLLASQKRNSFRMDFEGKLHGFDLGLSKMARSNKAKGNKQTKIDRAVIDKMILQRMQERKEKLKRGQR